MTPSPPPVFDPTNDPALRSWVESANDPATDFPIQNLPLCALESEHDGHAHAHLGTVIGDRIVDLGLLAMAGYFGDPQTEPLANLMHAPAWNSVAGRPDLMPEVRSRLQDFLRHDAHAGQQTRRLRDKALRPLAETRLLPPVAIFNYTDFYASKFHATNVGSMFRPDNPLLPNYVHVPIGYHGRASSIVLSGTPVKRPNGQTKADDASSPTFGPCKLLDYEMELGLVVAKGNAIGEPIDIASAADHMLGVCILNDWSARDMQKWEYQPLGPFLAKNFQSSISPFIVTMQALQPFRVAGPDRSADDPKPLDYLQSTDDWGLDITVEVALCTAKMREAGTREHRLSVGNAKDLYWTFAQMLTHHASNGCNLQPGDLLGSGTISGPDRSSRGCLLELTFDGNGPDGKPKRSPIQLPSGEKRTFLEDGDEVIMRAYCQHEGFRRIGLGECRGVIEA